jgi:hypothetical protein
LPAPIRIDIPPGRVILFKAFRGAATRDAPAALFDFRRRVSDRLSIPLQRNRYEYDNA